MTCPRSQEPQRQAPPKGPRTRSPAKRTRPEVASSSSRIPWKRPRGRRPRDVLKAVAWMLGGPTKQANHEELCRAWYGGHRGIPSGVATKVNLASKQFETRVVSGCLVFFAGVENAPRFLSIQHVRRFVEKGLQQCIVEHRGCMPTQKLH